MYRTMQTGHAGVLIHTRANTGWQHDEPGKQHPVQGSEYRPSPPQEAPCFGSEGAATSPPV
eukprot:1158890-Pelagomonas_calceolata.AAC.14